MKRALPLCLALAACGAADGATAALATATTAIKVASEVRRHLCSPVLDPLLGDPRPAQPSTPNPSNSSPPALPPAPQPSAPAPRVEGDGGVPNDATGVP